MPIPPIPNILEWILLGQEVWRIVRRNKATSPTPTTRVPPERNAHVAHAPEQVAIAITDLQKVGEFLEHVQQVAEQLKAVAPAHAEAILADIDDVAAIFETYEEAEPAATHTHVDPHAAHGTRTSPIPKLRKPSWWDRPVQLPETKLTERLRRHR